MKSESFGVDASYVEGAVSPFVSEVAGIFKAVDREAIEKEPRGGTLLRGPDTSGLGPEKGRLNRLHAAYIAAPSPDALNSLLAEVERYARRVTLGKGGAFAPYFQQSATDQYSASEISSSVMWKVWRNLDKFDGRSKFNRWVFRIARNVVKDKCLQIIRRREADLLEWKGYVHHEHLDDWVDKDGVGRGLSRRTIPGDSTDSDFNASEGYSLVLNQDDDRAPDERLVKLHALVSQLNDQDQAIVEMIQEGYKPREIGDRFGKNAKWASNNIDRVKKALKKLAERYPKEGLAKVPKPNVIVMKSKPLPASQAA